jgi:hypothetical protein
MKKGRLTGLNLSTNKGVTAEQHRLMDIIDRFSDRAENSSNPEVRKLASRAVQVYGDQLRNL